MQLYQALNQDKSYWCRNGETEKLKSADDGVSLLDIAAKTDNSGWQWSCQDKYYGQAKCELNQVACGLSAGSYVKGFSDLDQSRLCTYGQASSPYSVDAGVINWDCTDDVDRQVSCSVNVLTCQSPPDQGAYTDWDQLTKEDGVNCTDNGDDTYNCTGLCTDPNEQVIAAAKADGSGWEWFCGDDSCSAENINQCVSPPDGGGFASFQDLQNYLLDHNYSCLGNLCYGLCTDNKAHAISEKFDSNGQAIGWTWQCGPNDCQADKVDCAEPNGEYLLNLNPQTDGCLELYDDNDPTTVIYKVKADCADRFCRGLNFSQD